MNNIKQRKDYIEKIKPFINKPIIKVLTGIRRSGNYEGIQSMHIADWLLEEGYPFSIALEMLKFNFATYSREASKLDSHTREKIAKLKDKNLIKYRKTKI